LSSSNVLSQKSFELNFIHYVCFQYNSSFTNMWSLNPNSIFCDSSYQTSFWIVDQISSLWSFDIFPKQSWTITNVRLWYRQSISCSNCPHSHSVRSPTFKFTFFRRIIVESLCPISQSK
jgi:hypothetical protein